MERNYRVRLTELLATNLAREELVNHRIHLRLCTTPFAEIQPAISVEVVLREADLFAAFPKPKLRVSEVRLHIPMKIRGVCKRHRARCGLRLINDRSSNIVPTEAIAQDWNEVGNNDSRVVDDANVMKLNVGCDWPDGDRCAPAEGKSNREYRESQNIHKSPLWWLTLEFSGAGAATFVRAQAMDRRPLK